MHANNMLDDISTDIQAEQFFTLLENGCVTIERIVSHGSSSPVDFWYDQAEPEWVLVFRGRATLEFASGELVQLKEGDYLTIPAHTRHRVAETASDTIWLAVYVKKHSS
jgi:cupin 2 domain-containing protein